VLRHTWNASIAEPLEPLGMKLAADAPTPATAGHAHEGQGRGSEALGGGGVGRRRLATEGEEGGQSGAPPEDELLHRSPEQRVSRN